MNDESTKPEVCYLYVLRSPATGEFYYGSAVNDEKRKSEHLRELQKGTHGNYKFQKAYNRDPELEFASVPISEPGLSAFDTRHLALDLEEILIRSNLDNPKLLNIATDALAPFNGRKHTEETKEKIRESRLEHFVNGGKKPGSPFVGKSLPEHVNQRLQEGKKAFHDSMTQEEKDEYYLQRAQNRCKEVVVGDKVYPSRLAAATAEGITPPTVTDRINSSGFPNWHWK